MITFFEQGGVLMIPLLLCSLLAVTIILERLIFWIRTSMGYEDQVVESLFDSVEAGKLEQIVQDVDLPGDARAEILVLALKEDQTDLKTGLRLKTEFKAESMKRGLMVLDTIITLAPLLGILGTVTGIISSFEILGLEGTPKPQEVSHGIAKALITTAAGLSIAIATVIPYNYFQSKLLAFLREMERHSSRLVVLVQGQTERARDH